MINTYDFELLIISGTFIVLIVAVILRLSIINSPLILSTPSRLLMLICVLWAVILLILFGVLSCECHPFQCKARGGWLSQAAAMGLPVTYLEVHDLVRLTLHIHHLMEWLLLLLIHVFNFGRFILVIHHRIALTFLFLFLSKAPVHGVLQHFQRAEALLEHGILSHDLLLPLVLEPVIPDPDLTVSVDLIALSGKVVVQTLEFDRIPD